MSPFSRYLLTCDERLQTRLLGTVRDLARYFPMNEDRAEYYRRQAELCLEQAELAPDGAMRVRMRFIADEWLKMAARAALRAAA
jgi:hypothetical protein